MSSGLYVELPAMPGASDHVLLQVAFGERTASVWANSIHCMKRAFDVENRHDAATYDKFASFTRRNLRHTADSIAAHNLSPFRR